MLLKVGNSWSKTLVNPTFRTNRTPAKAYSLASEYQSACTLKIQAEGYLHKCDSTGFNFLSLVEQSMDNHASYINFTFKRNGMVMLTDILLLSVSHIIVRPMHIILMAVQGHFNIGAMGLRWLAGFSVTSHRSVASLCRCLVCGAEDWCPLSSEGKVTDPIALKLLWLGEF